MSHYWLTTYTFYLQNALRAPQTKLIHLPNAQRHTAERRFAKLCKQICFISIETKQYVQTLLYTTSSRMSYRTACMSKLEVPQHQIRHMSILSTGCFTRMTKPQITGSEWEGSVDPISLRTTPWQGTQHPIILPIHLTNRILIVPIVTCFPQVYPLPEGLCIFTSRVWGYRVGSQGPRHFPQVRYVVL